MVFLSIRSSSFIAGRSMDPQSAIAADGKICPSGKKSGVIYIYILYIHISFEMLCSIYSVPICEKLTMFDLFVELM